MLERKLRITRIFQNGVCAQRLHPVIELKHRGDPKPLRDLGEGEDASLRVSGQLVPLIAQLAPRRGEAVLQAVVVVLVKARALHLNQRIPLALLPARHWLGRAVPQRHMPLRVHLNVHMNPVFFKGNVHFTHPFTAPTVMPLMKYFCNEIKRIAMGSTEITMAAKAVE